MAEVDLKIRISTHLTDVDVISVTKEDDLLRTARRTAGHVEAGDRRPSRRRRPEGVQAPAVLQRHIAVYHLHRTARQSRRAVIRVDGIVDGDLDLDRRIRVRGRRRQEGVLRDGTRRTRAADEAQQGEDDPAPSRSVASHRVPPGTAADVSRCRYLRFSRLFNRLPM